MTPAEAAPLFYEAGFNIMPLHGKRPVGEWGELQRRRATLQNVTRFLNNHPNANLGIVCGELSGVTVVDVDISGDFDMEAFGKFLKAYPTPLMVQTGSGGWHLYYAYANVKNAVKTQVMGLALDVRSQGGYVVCPPSIHPDTQMPYRFINLNDPSEELDLETILSLRDNLPPLPPPLVEALRTDRKKLPDDWRRIIYDTNQGSRNQSAASLFGKLMGVLPPSEWQAVVYPLVAGWNEKWCNPPLSDTELQTTYRSVAKSALARLQWSGPGDLVPADQSRQPQV